jgi:salicylate hydroxylase
MLEIRYLLTTDTTSTGIAGLSAAYALAASGHRVQVLERARGLQHQPGGAQIPPNATRILTHWGLGRELAQRAATTSSSSILDCEYHASIIFFRLHRMLRAGQC